MSKQHVVPRRRAMLAGLTAALPSGAPAFAQAFPSRPVRVVVIAPPGTSPDIALRMLAEPLTRRWGQPVVVDNRAGANGNLGAQAILRGNPDGHLLLFTSASPMVMNEHLTRNPPFNPARDFTPISLLLTTPFMISASPTLGVSTMDELIALARTRAAPLTFASPGATTVARFTGERMGRAAGIPLTNVPYVSSSQGVTDLLAGRVDLMVDGTPVLAPLAGVRHLAVTSAERIAGFEAVPTLAERFPGVVSIGWLGLVGPEGMPDELAARIAADFAEALLWPAMRTRFRDALGAEAVGNTPVEFGRFMAGERAGYGRLVCDLNVSMD